MTSGESHAMDRFWVPRAVTDIFLGLFGTAERVEKFNTQLMEKSGEIGHCTALLQGVDSTRCLPQAEPPMPLEHVSRWHKRQDLKQTVRRTKPKVSRS